MENIRSKEEKLNDFLDKESAWRKKEISQLRLLLDSPDSEQVSIRCSIVLLYAHWEGFIKKAATAYLGFLSKCEIQIQDLNPALQAFALNNKCFSSQDKINTTKNIEDILDIVYKNEAINVVFSSHENWIKTNSNLTSSIFEKIVNSLGLKCTDFYQTEELSIKHIIDEVLLKHRNEIAHGERISVNPRDHKSTALECFLVASLIDKFKKILIDGVSCECYLKNSDN